MACSTPAGTHRARVGGSTQVPSGEDTVRMPEEAQASWCAVCQCVSYRRPAEENAATRIAPSPRVLSWLVLDIT